MSLRIAILTHSTNPRGGVVHALELGEALVQLGHHAVVHAPDPQQAGFFREASSETISVPATLTAKNLVDLVATRRQDYRQYFQQPANRDFDVFHAQDSISANALADLKAGFPGFRFARTVHHLDHFADDRLMALQARGVAAADRHFVVSRQWQLYLARDFGLSAGIVGNGVDRTRFNPNADAEDAPLQARLNLGPGPVLLSIGGIEERKNSLLVLQAFQAIRCQYPTAQLVVAGGASLLDHDRYQQEFHQAREAMRLPDNAICITGAIPQAAMPALYRAAAALVFPSISEGFGLAVLEAAACGVPVVTSRIAPFTEYLGPDDVAWCDPYDIRSIAQAIIRALQPEQRDAFMARGAAVAARHDWQQTATAHLNAYETMREKQDA
jgi:glycosyltransferase-like protein